LPILEVEEVSKSFGGLRALQRVSLSVEPGAIFGLIGPNGAGKTTLFNVISGLYRPDGGRVHFEGTNLVGLSPHLVCRRGVARTFQLVQPFARMSVLDNVAAGALFGRGDGRRRSLDEVRRTASVLLPLGRLEGKAHMPAGSLTLSERKRLEMVRALATSPRLLLLDEVMAGLTPAEAAGIVTVIKQIREEFDLTILLIEHNVRLVMELAHQVTVLNHGMVIASGQPGEVVTDAEVVKAYLGERWAGPRA
jgi:branched-chain amino acid transport system ATP-binding protein